MLHDIQIETVSGQIIATLIFPETKEKFSGVATYREGDIYDVRRATLIAKAKAWRKFWHKQSTNASSKYRDLVRQSETAIDTYITYAKKEKELSTYIEKICHEMKGRGESKGSS